MYVYVLSIETASEGGSVVGVFSTLDLAREQQPGTWYTCDDGDTWQLRSERQQFVGYHIIARYPLIQPLTMPPYAG